MDDPDLNQESYQAVKECIGILANTLEKIVDNAAKKRIQKSPLRAAPTVSRPLYRGYNQYVTVKQDQDGNFSKIYTIRKFVPLKPGEEQIERPTSSGDVQEACSIESQSEQEDGRRVVFQEQVQQQVITPLPNRSRSTSVSFSRASATSTPKRRPEVRRGQQRRILNDILTSNPSDDTTGAGRPLVLDNSRRGQTGSSPQNIREMRQLQATANDERGQSGARRSPQNLRQWRTLQPVGSEGSRQIVSQNIEQSTPSLYLSADDQINHLDVARQSEDADFNNMIDVVNEGFEKIVKSLQGKTTYECMKNNLPQDPQELIEVLFTGLDEADAKIMELRQDMQEILLRLSSIIVQKTNQAVSRTNQLVREINAEGVCPSETNRAVQTGASVLNVTNENLENRIEEGNGQRSYQELDQRSGEPLNESQILGSSSENT